MEIERVKDYRAPGPGDTEKVKAATKLPPLCNYPGEGFAQMTQAEWDKKHKDYKIHSRRRRDRNPCAASGTSCNDHGYKYGHIFITDAKRVDPPAAPLPLPVPRFSRVRRIRANDGASPSMEKPRDPRGHSAG